MGHISPLIGIILELKDKYNFTYFGLENSMEEAICKKYSITFHKMKLLPFYRKNIFKNLLTFYYIHKERRIIRKLYKQNKPDFIISSGGFVSIPLILSFRNRKKLLLESNTTMGLANKLLSHFVDYVGVQFDTIKCNKKVFVGNPIKVFNQSFDHPYFYSNDPVILFVGGSNGAFDIVKIAFEFNQKYPSIKLFVITGENYFDTFKFGENAKVFKKIPELSSILNKFNLVVSRAGAATITELLLANVAFVLVPSYNVSANHQVLNAKYIEENDACNVIYDIKNPKYLSELYDLLHNIKKRNEMILAQKKLQITDSILRVSKLIEKDINKNIFRK